MVHFKRIVFSPFFKIIFNMNQSLNHSRFILKNRRSYATPCWWSSFLEKTHISYYSSSVCEILSPMTKLLCYVTYSFVWINTCDWIIKIILCKSFVCRSLKDSLSETFLNFFVTVDSAEAIIDLWKMNIIF